LNNDRLVDHILDRVLEREVESRNRLSPSTMLVDITVEADAKADRDLFDMLRRGSKERLDLVLVHHRRVDHA
jgi:hypothetical protein